MFVKIKNRIERELTDYIRQIDRLYSLNKISPVLFSHIKEFISRKGKRIRPILFVAGYLGYAKKACSGLYRSALSLELLHDFMLVHDDIIDKSDSRRGRPSMHAMLNTYLKGFRNLKFNGQDLTIVIGDVMFALALHSFLAVKEDLQRKERALKKLIETALYTGSGEFIELLSGLKSMDETKESDIYKIYDLKTANYTFATPLAIGAILAGAGKRQVDKLFNYGIYLGRAFQIKDDILGLFSEESETGKSNLTDLKESKKTIPVWYAYHNAGTKDKSCIKDILLKHNADKDDLLRMRKIITVSGALDYAENKISVFLRKAHSLNRTLEMRGNYKNLLAQYSKELLKIS